MEMKRDKSVMICIDSCNFFEIPNVFTPNEDGINDRLVAKSSGLVDKIDFRYLTVTDYYCSGPASPELTGMALIREGSCLPGVYFYQCDVYERRISGLELFHLSGFVHVITEEGSKVKNVATK